MSMCRVFSCVVGRGCAMTSAFCWQNSVSLWPASLCMPRPNLPVTPKSKRVPGKHLLLLCWLYMPKPLTVWITTNCGKFLNRWEYQITWHAPWEICMQVKKQQLEPDIEQQIGSKSGKAYVKAVYCHPAYLTYMQSTSWDRLDWMKHKLESRLPGEISITSDMQMTPPLYRKQRRTKETLDESERREWKCWLKAQHSEN